MVKKGMIKTSHYAKGKNLLIAVWVAVLSFSLVACNNATPNSTQDENKIIQHVYDDPLFGSFSVEFPQKWIVTELKSQPETAEVPETLFSMLTLRLDNKTDDCIKFQMDKTWMFYENVVEERGTYSKSRTEELSDNKQVDIYVDSSTSPDNVYLIYIYGKDDTIYYYGEVIVSKTAYDANRDAIEHIMKSFTLR